MNLNELFSGLEAAFGKGSVHVIDGQDAIEKLTEALRAATEGECDCDGCKAERAAHFALVEAVAPIMHDQMEAAGCDNVGNQMRLEVIATRTAAGIDFDVKTAVRESAE